MTGIASGYSELDDMTGGFQNGDLIIIGGRPSMGKSVFAANVTSRVVSAGLGVGFFSLEMASQLLMEVMLSCRARIEPSAIRKGRLTEKQYVRLQKEAEALSRCPLFVNDKASMTTAELRVEVTHLKNQHDIKLVVIDYMQLLKDRHSSSKADFSFIPRFLKGVARDCGLPVIALSRLRGSTGSREDHRPRLSDLPDVSIEDNADCILMLCRQGYYGRREEDRGIAEIIVAKQRSGPTGMCSLQFLDQYVCFENLPMQGNLDF